MLIDSIELKKRIDEYCVKYRPNSYTLTRLIEEMEKQPEPILAQKNYEADYSNDVNVTHSIKLDLAVEVFVKMMEEMESITIKDFLQELMYQYDMSQYDILER